MQISQFHKCLTVTLILVYKGVIRTTEEEKKQSREDADGQLTCS